eukprot:CAMPEP_0198283834 /NCGR_PEP_ID=MMETSP1449-20131203/3438_1 /TAXON_ID=420275 /ORGANISM="Attheya septentrionalis, Strain CCMP2084" /LENGTH=70 /DNA_ID=CAMNT_0043980695 /DNA_START=201 /DNA_END=410 /DNA_ORIENTATION=+
MANKSRASRHRTTRRQPPSRDKRVPRDTNILQSQSQPQPQTIHATATEASTEPLLPSSSVVTLQCDKDDT